MTFAIPFLTKWLLGKWCERAAALITNAIFILAIASAVYGAYCWAWDRGRDHERGEWQAEVTKIRKARDDAMVKARKYDKIVADKGNAAITKKRKEIDDETANLPDQGLTARQRARANTELRRKQRR